MQQLWDFLQDQILGMKWLNELIGRLLTACGLDVTGRIGGSIRFFIYDTIKIMVLLGVALGLVDNYLPLHRRTLICPSYQKRP